MNLGHRLIGCIAWGLLALPAAALSHAQALPQVSGLPGAAVGAGAAGFDPRHTRFGFELRTRWGQRVLGEFPAYDGAVLSLPDGRSQAYIRLATGAVEVADSPRYTELARGEDFFDAARFPQIEFVSEPHQVALGHDGGKLRGRLTMHGVSRMETFVVAPATCSRPGQDCDAVATGSVNRSHYALDGWRMVLSDKVRFTMRIRLQDAMP